MFTWEKYTYARIWGLRRGEGVCPKRVYFQEPTVYVCMIYSFCLCYGTPIYHTTHTHAPCSRNIPPLMQQYTICGRNIPPLTQQYNPCGRNSRCVCHLWPHAAPLICLRIRTIVYNTSGMQCIVGGVYCWVRGGIFRPQGVYCWVRGVYFGNQYSSWLSVHSSTEKHKTCFCNGRTNFPQLSLGDTASTIEPPYSIQY